MNYNIPKHVRLARARLILNQMRKENAAATYIVFGCVAGAFASVGIFLLELKQGEYMSEMIWNTIERLLS